MVKNLSNTVFVRGLPYTTNEKELKDFIESIMLKGDAAQEADLAPTPAGSMGKLLDKCMIIRDKKTYESKGYAFVQFKLGIDAQRAVQELNKKELGGRVLSVEAAQPKGYKLEGKETERKPKQQQSKQHDFSAQQQQGEEAVSTSAYDDSDMVENNIFYIDKTAAPTPVVDSTTVATEAPQTDDKEQQKLHPQDRKNTLWLRGLPFSIPIEHVNKILTQRFCNFGKIANIRIPAKKDKATHHQGYAFVEFVKEKHAKRAHEQTKNLVIGGRPIEIDFKLKPEEYLAVKQTQKPTDNTETETETETADASDAMDVDKDTAEKSDVDSDSETDSGDDDSESVSSDDDSESADDDIENTEDDDEINDYYKDDDDHSEGAESESEEDSDSEDDDVENAKQMQQRHNDLKKTAFIRNLPYSATEDQIKEKFVQYGPIQYVALVKDKSTKLPNGTAFIKFKYQQGMDKLLEAVELTKRLRNIDESTSTDKPMSKRMMKRQKKQGKVTAEDGIVDGLDIEGRAVRVAPALTKDESKRMQEASLKAKTDKRNLYLAMEGFIAKGTPAAKDLDPRYLSKIAKSFREKKAALKNPNFSVSATRLCVRNLNKVDMTEKKLRDLFMRNAVKPTTDAKGNTISIAAQPKIKQVKIVREKGSNVSKGFAFVEFERHEHALSALRALNNNPHVFGPARRLLVEFALEDARKKQKLQQSMQAGQKMREAAAAAKAEKSKVQPTASTNTSASGSDANGNGDTQKPLTKQEKFKLKKEQRKLRKQQKKQQKAAAAATEAATATTSETSNTATTTATADNNNNVSKAAAAEAALGLTTTNKPQPPAANQKKKTAKEEAKAQRQAKKQEADRKRKLAELRRVDKFGEELDPALDEDMPSRKKIRRGKVSKRKAETKESSRESRYVHHLAKLDEDEN